MCFPHSAHHQPQRCWAPPLRAGDKRVGRWAKCQTDACAVTQRRVDHCSSCLGPPSLGHQCRPGISEAGGRGREGGAGSPEQGNRAAHQGHFGAVGCCLWVSGLPGRELACRRRHCAAAADTRLCLTSPWGPAGRHFTFLPCFLRSSVAPGPGFLCCAFSIAGVSWGPTRGQVGSAGPPSTPRPVAPVSCLQERHCSLGLPHPRRPSCNPGACTRLPRPLFSPHPIFKALV